VITAGVLLASGASRRFGAADKLLAPLEGRPIVAHAAAALAQAVDGPLIVVAARAEVAAALPGFTHIRPGHTAPEQSDSLAAGIAQARALGAGRVVVVLGDMPRVTAELIRAVLARCGPSQVASAATDGTRPMPPACFTAALFDRLETLSGDRGAAPVLRELPKEQLVAAQPGTLVDIDTEADLAAAAGAPD
jgi:CTP:molybdopterin cytidylyltransferase MocA